MFSSGPNQVLDFLYIGGQYDAFEKKIEPLGIRYILNVAGGSVQTKQGFKKLIIPIDDFGRDILNSKNILGRCFTFIQEAKQNGNKVVVHCRSGINRSATVVLAYLVKYENFTLKDAFLHLRSVRPIVSPHEDYWEQLKQFEKELTGNISICKADIGVSFQEQMREFLGSSRQHQLEDTLPS